MDETYSEYENASTDPSQDSDLEDLIRANEARAATYGFLARLYRREVDEALLDELFSLHYPVSSGNENLDEANRLFATYLSGLWANSVTELAADFSRTFFGHGYSGHAAAYPFESVYASEKRLLMQDARDEILALYRSAGLDKSDDWKEGEDHIALQLEYLQVLVSRCVLALQKGDEDAAYNLIKRQYNFMVDHLGAWSALLTEQMKNFAKTDFYQALAYMTDGFVETEIEFMEDILGDD